MENRNAERPCNYKEAFDISGQIQFKYNKPKSNDYAVMPAIVKFKKKVEKEPYGDRGKSKKKLKLIQKGLGFELFWCGPVILCGFSCKRILTQGTGIVSAAYFYITIQTLPHVLMNYLRCIKINFGIK